MFPSLRGSIYINYSAQDFCIGGLPLLLLFVFSFIHPIIYFYHMDSWLFILYFGLYITTTLFILFLKLFELDNSLLYHGQPGCTPHAGTLMTQCLDWSVPQARPYRTGFQRVKRPSCHYPRKIRRKQGENRVGGSQHSIYVYDHQVLMLLVKYSCLHLMNSISETAVFILSKDSTPSFLQEAEL